MICNDARLSAAITAGPDSPTNEELSQHLSSCTRCQGKMEQMAAPSDWWEEASTVLGQPDEHRSTIVISLESSLAPDAEVQPEEISLEFLQPPSHPEMLGRLGRYEVERVIGAGGMGVVLKAFDTELNRPVAIKVLAPHLSHSGAARRRFSREAQAAAAIVHENVIPIYDVQDTSELPYLVMQYVPGESLQARVDRDGPLSTEEMLRISAQVAAGLAAAHEQGLVHRDVKPANILLQEAIDRVLISDFGLARTADDASLTRTGIVAGTPHYMSPEQARGTTIDCRSDQFGLGSVLYFMCTGHPPFRADGAMAVLNRICHDSHRPVDEVNTQVPPNVSDLIDRLLEKSPEQRFGSVDLVTRSLTVALVSWREPGRRHRVRQTTYRRWIRKRPIVSAAALIGTLVAIGAIAFAAGNWRQGSANGQAAEGDNRAIRLVAPTTTVPPPDGISLPSVTDTPVISAGVDPAKTTPIPGLESDESFNEEVMSIRAALEEWEQNNP